MMTSLFMLQGYLGAKLMRMNTKPLTRIFRFTSRAGWLLTSSLTYCLPAVPWRVGLSGGFESVLDAQTCWSHCSSEQSTHHRRASSGGSAVSVF